MTTSTDFGKIAVGAREEIVKRITESDIRRFVELTGDDNPLHVDRRFAESTALKDIVVHGMLGASFISTVIGTKLPGPGALWLTQSIEFLLPVRLDDELTVSVTVLKKHDRERLLELETRILNQHGQLVLTGLGKVQMLAGTTSVDPADNGTRPRVAIVTGGGGGIGRAICSRLARDGHHVVINCATRIDRAEELARALTTGHTRAIAVQADISTAKGCRELFRRTEESFGNIGILVNCASPRIGQKPFDAMSWDDVQYQLDVQVKGAFLMAKMCLPKMVAQHYGRIVNITSQVVDGAPSVQWTGYAVAKAALAQLTRYLAAEYGASGVTVNSVAPGMTETTLIGEISAKTQMMIARQTPMRRLATPDDVAAAVAHLVSDESDFVTGHSFRVNGGAVMA